MQCHVTSVNGESKEKSKPPQIHYPSNNSAKFQLGKTTKNK